MSHDRAWDETTPTSSEKAGLWYEHLNQLKEDIAQRMAVDHHWDESISDTDPNQDGIHKKVTLSNTDPVTSGIADCGILHVKDVDGKAELFFMDENNNDVQITSNGFIHSVREVYSATPDGYIILGKNSNRRYSSFSYVNYLTQGSRAYQS